MLSWIARRRRCTGVPGLWDKPPLDVSLAPDGRLAAVQFVLQDERVPRDGGKQLAGDGTGGSWPVFEVASWPDGRYLDEDELTPV